MVMLLKEQQMIATRAHVTRPESSTLRASLTTMELLPVPTAVKDTPAFYAISKLYKFFKN